MDGLRRQQVSWLKQHSAPTSGVSFSPFSDKSIASVGLDMKLYTFDTSSRTSSSCISYEAPYSSLAFAYNRLTLASGTTTGQAKAPPPSYFVRLENKSVEDNLSLRRRTMMCRWLCCTCQVEESYHPHENEHLKSPRNNADVKPDVQKATPPIEVPSLSLEELKEKIDNFGSKALIGEGAYGRVYFTQFNDGKEVVVKKFDVASEPDSNVEFLTQLMNLLQWDLYTTFCPDGKECKKHNLVLHLIGCNGDIRSSNVLLFEDYKAKIADFNLSNQAPDMAARLYFTRVLGAFGYHAPEKKRAGELINNTGNATPTKESRWFSAVLPGILMCKVGLLHFHAIVATTAFLYLFIVSGLFNSQD
ncbi:hypothetical protein ACS0TY_034613 [Phlomoides rotata]